MIEATPTKIKASEVKITIDKFKKIGFIIKIIEIIIQKILEIATFPQLITQ
jgi:hypothetical protein